MAATDWWRIDVTGRGAHGAMPNQGADAVLAGAAIVQSLQAIVARNMSPFEPAVVTVGQFHGGTARNVMAGSAWMEGTVRTFHEAAHKRIPQLMERMAQDTAAAYGCTATLSYEVAHSTVVNTPEASELCARAPFPAGLPAGLPCPRTFPGRPARPRQPSSPALPTLFR